MLFLDVNVIHHPHLLLIHSHHLSIIFHLIFLWYDDDFEIFLQLLEFYFLKFHEAYFEAVLFSNFYNPSMSLDVDDFDVLTMVDGCGN